MNSNQYESTIGQDGGTYKKMKTYYDPAFQQGLTAPEFGGVGYRRLQNGLPHGTYSGVGYFSVKNAYLGNAGQGCKK